MNEDWLRKLTPRAADRGSDNSPRVLNEGRDRAAIAIHAFPAGTRRRLALGGVFCALLAVVALAFTASARADVTPTITTTWANTAAGAASDLTMTTSFASSPAGDDVRRLAFDLPAGEVGNPNAITSANRCGVDYTGTPPAPNYSTCPASSDVGNISVNVTSGACTNSPITVSGNIYVLRNRPSASPEVPTRLGIHVSGTCWALIIPLTVNMDFTAEIRLRADDAGLRIKMLEDIARTDPIIGGAIKINSITQTIVGVAPGGQTFMSNPTRCDAWVTRVYTRAYDSNSNVDADIDATIAGNDHKMGSSTLASPNCGSLPAFSPGFTLTPTTTQAGQPVGFTATLTNSFATPRASFVKRTDLQFPLGYQINPAIASQVGSMAAACSDAQFNEANPETAPTCPASSEVGTVSIATPLITGGVTGKVYLGTPVDSGNNRYRLFVYAANGAAVKFQARAKVAANGQVTVEFGNAADTGKYLPQFPWTSFTLVFYTNGSVAGSKAMITNPQVCGTYTGTATITPWTSPNQSAVTFNPSLSVTAGPNAGGCNFDPFNPSFSATVSDTGAGKHPNLSLSVTRGDRQDNLKDMTFRFPSGFAGSTTAVTPCPAATAAAGACTSTSQVGTVAVQVGTGPDYVTLNGTVHLTDAAASEIAKVAIQVPVVVGPFDLGVTVMYGSLVLNSTTSFGLDALTANMPQMIQGIPVRYRSVTLTLNGIVGGRPFLQNPSVCGTQNWQATLGSAAEAPASGVSTVVRTDTDQSTNGCPTTFNPSISVSASSTATAQPTGLTVTVNVPQTTTGVTTSTVQQSTVKRVQLTLPPGMEINPGFANGLTACATATIDAGGGGCAASSRIGTVTLTTPLLAAPQTGNVYIETPGGTPTTRYKLAIVVNLPSGYLVIRGTAQVNGSGSGADSGTGQVTADFDNLPDVPFSSFAFVFNSGPGAMLTNPTTCGTQTVSAAITPNSTGGAVANRTATYTTSYNGSGGACPGSDPFNPTYAQSVTTTVAGAHPDVTMTVTRPDKDQQLRDMTFSWPVGLTGAPAAVPTCPQASADAGTCPANTQVGTITTQVGSGSQLLSLSGTIHNTVAPANQPAKMTAIVPVVAGPYNLGTLSIPINATLRSDMGLDITVANLPQRFEGIPVRYRQIVNVINGVVNGSNFLTNPSKCQLNTTNASLTSIVPTTVVRSAGYTTTGCPMSFNPSITASVSTSETAKPTGLTLGINVPVGHSTLGRVQMTLPPGMEINPAFTNGPLQACSTALIDAGGAGCPATSVIGAVSLTTPLLTGAQTGNVYLETPGVTAATRYKLAIVIHLPGRDLVMHGSAQVDGSSDLTGGVGASDTGTGRVSTDFNNLPDLAFTNMTLTFNSGNRAMLTNPSACGSHTVSADLTPNTTGGAIATRTANFTTDYDGAGGACPGSDPWAPSFTGSVTTTVAGAHPDLTMTVTRADKNQQLRNLNLHLPTGLAANTSATTRCSQANAALGNCLASQQVGTITTAIGSGGESASISGGLYNVVPNAGEPARFQAVIPVVVGPFDLGKLSIPVTTSLRADWGIDAATQIPLRYEGVPVRIRTLQMVLSGTVGGSGFMTNPSKCQGNTVSADMISASSTTVTGSFSYTTTGCAIAFNPSITASVSTTETAKPTGLTLGINVPADNSTVGRVQATLPVGMDLNPAAGNGPLQACSTVAIDAGGAACPATSDQGDVTLTTPLLASPVTGDVYLETPGVTPATRYKLAIVLRIPGRDLVIHGSAQVNGSGGGIDSGDGQVTADFNGLPDLGFSNLTIAFNAGNRALFTNPASCGANTVSMDLTPNTSGGAVATRTANFTTDYDGSGGACPGSDPWSPSFSGSVSTTAAGGNPNVTLNVTRADKQQQLRNLNIHLPAGMVANATAVPQCAQVDAAAGNCLASQQVGTVATTIGSGAETLATSGGIYNVVPNLNEPARLQAIIPVVVGPFDLGKLSIPVLTSLRSDMGVDANTQIPLRYEGVPVRIRSLQMVLSGTVGGNGFMINPSKCQVNTVTADMVSDSANTATGSFNFTTTGCPSNFVSGPTITAAVSPSETARPTGLNLAVNSAANNPTIGRIQVTLPAGMEINPAVGNGPLQACATADIDAGGAACPASSNLGTVSLTTPLLTGGQSGNIYLETPGSTAATRYKLAIVIHLPGRDLIVRGSAQVNGSTDIVSGAGSVDTGTGRVTTDFNNIPDLAFTNLTIAFNTGNRALLLNPEACGSHTVNATISPNSGGVDATPSAGFTTSYDGLGAACPGTDPFAPVFTGSVSSTLSGGNPNLTLGVTLPAKSQQLRSFNLHLPPGLVANTVATPRCSQANAAVGNCVAANAVGTVSTEIGSGAETLALTGTLYNVDPNVNEPARLAAVIPVVVGPFNLGNLSLPVTTSLRADYGVDTTTQIPNRYEGIAVRIRSLQIVVNGMVGGQPFMINPSKCQSNTVTADMISASSTTVTGSFSYSTTGCPKDFVVSPTISASVSPNETAKPAGLTLGVDSSASNPTVKRVQMTLPPGMEINPAAGNGPLQACPTADIDAGGAACPPSSNQGTVSLTTPLLPTVQTGNVYLETPGSTAATRYKLAIVIHIPSKDLVLHGSVQVNGSTDIAGGTGAIDSGTGQVTADFDNIPDLAFTNLTIAFNTGNRALLLNPETCGSHAVGATITPNSGGNAMTPSTTFTTSYDGAGGACPGSDPWSPSFSGSVSTTAAGGNPNVTLNVTRPDKSQQLRNLNIHLPAGMVANATVVPQCAQVDATAGNCLASQQVGTVATTIGSGAETLAVSGGIYNVVPNANEPARLQAIIPVAVGPFDLGKLTIPVLTSLRSDMGVDATTQIPLRYEGIAVRVRTMNMVLSGIVGGNGFMINPSRCQVNTVSADMVSDGANTATGSFNFTTTGCPSNFVSSPTIAATLTPTETAKPTGLTLDVNSAASNPTIGRIQTTFPVGMEINPAVGNGPLQACSSADIDAGGAACPGASVLGTVSLTTPLLTGVRNGNIFLETPGSTAATRYKLAIVIDLPGQKLVVRGSAQVNGSSDIVGGVGSADTGNGRVTADFNNIPDLAFTNLHLAFNTGNRALFTAPEACGSHSINATITPNTGGSDATPSASFTTSYDGAGAPCPGSDPFAPTFTGSVSTTVSGGHPNLNLQITRPDKHRPLRQFNMHLPVGFVADTVATPRCSQANAAAGNCAASTVVGSITTEVGSGGETLQLSGTINNTETSASEPARLTAIIPVVVGPFDLGKLSIPITTSLRGDLGVDTATTIPLRYEGVPVRVRDMQIQILGMVAGNGFMVNPSRCRSNTVTADMLSTSGGPVSGSFSFNTTGCPTTFLPTIAADVSDYETGQPAGLSLDINVPANSSTLRRVVTTLPVGMEINPAVANNNGGLAACDTADIDAGGLACPAGSVIGAVTLDTPLLPNTQSGVVYLETPGATPATRYKLAIVVTLPGQYLVLHGTATVNGSGGGADTGDGRVVATFDNLPDLRFSNLHIQFNTGDDALLTNPLNCGTHTVSAVLAPWSDDDEGNSPDYAVTRNDTFTTSYDGAGAACPGSDPFAPTFSVGVSDTTAGASPNVTLTVGRTDKHQQLRNFNLHLPTGLVANTTATPLCSQADAGNGTCAAATTVGTFSAEVGSGPDTLTLSTGTIHNVQPNVGEPARLSARLPVAVGPYDLGVITIPIPVSLRSDLGVDATTQLPLRWEGVPVRIRSLQMTLNGIVGGNRFMVNPSKCQVNTVSADMISPSLTSVTGTDGYTTTGCPAGFGTAPTISASVNPSETAKPTGLTIGVNSAAGNPTIKRVQMALPVGMEINPAVGNGLATCSTAMIDAGGAGCPVASQQGTVTLTTPLLTGPQTGKIYLEDPGSTAATRYKLAIVIDVPGQKIVVHGGAQVNGSSDIVGGTGSADTGTGQVTADFDDIPDLGFSNMTIAFNTGDRALLSNPEACGTHTVNATITPNSGGADATPSASFTTSYDGLGGSCPGTDPFAPTFTGSVSTTASGGNPDLTLHVTRPDKHRPLRQFNMHLPVGLVADTVATPRCTQLNAAAGNCLASTVVGSITTEVGSGNETLSLSGTLNNTETNPSEPARLTAIVPVVVGPFDLGKLTIPITTSLRGDLGVDTQTTIPLRYEGVPVRVRDLQIVINGIVGGNGFMVNPSRCKSNTVSVDMVPTVGAPVTGSFSFNTTGCPGSFNPSITADVSDYRTGQPTGLSLDVNVPADSSSLRRVVTTLPAGMEINPAVGDNNGGLDACSTAAIDAGGMACPVGSVIGTVTLDTPLLPNTQLGNVYLETPGATPATRYKLAIVVALPGQYLVLHGTATVDGSGQGADSGIGRVVATFDDLPDLRFSNLHIQFFTGDNALLTNPLACGTHTVSADLTPWSDDDEGASPDYTTTRTATFDTSYDGAGAPCPGTDPFNPTFSASVSDTTAGGHPDLTLNIGRPDRDQQLRGFNLHLPTGLVANANAVPKCPQVDAANGTCLPGTTVGLFTATVGADTGTFSLTTGTIHNVEPNANEPARLSASLPVVVGPFDLGVINIAIPATLNSSLGVDTTAQLPLRWEGVPVRIRSLQMIIDGVVGGNNYLINPSKCQVNTISADMVSPLATSVTGTSSFTTTGCPAGFTTAPTITAAVSPSETAKPTGLTIGINTGIDNPTIKRVRMALPVGMEINPAVGNGLATCPTATIDAGGAGCPAASQQGTVTLTTPLLTGPQTGKIYLEDPGGSAATRYKLAIVVDLPGQKLIVHGGATVDGSSDLTGGTGSVDSGTGRVTADFDDIPDLGFSNMTIAFNTGDRALLSNPEACGTHTVNATITPNSGGADATPSASFTTSYDGAGAPCPGSDPFGPTFGASVSDTTAAGHPDLTVNLTRPDKHQQLRDFDLHLPVGMVANSSAVAQCSQAAAAAGTCAAASQVGTITTEIGTGNEGYTLSTGALHNVVPNASEPARLAAIVPVVVGPFDLGTLSIPVTTALRADFGVDVSATFPLRYEGIAVRIRSMQMVINGVVGGNNYMINPSKCQLNTISADLTSPSASSVTGTSSFTTTGCPAGFTTAPTITAAVSPSETAKPTGLTIGVDTGIDNPTIKRIRMALPVGMEINPAVGNGLATCPTATIDAGGAGCPASSQQGTVTLTTPLLSGSQTGKIYLEDPGSTAATRYKLGIVIDLPGQKLVLHGSAQVDGSSDVVGGLGAADSGTGQVTADFDDIPDLGFSNMTIAFNTGDRALLTNPEACGSHTVGATITPNSGGADATPSASFTTSYDGAGAPCPGTDPQNPSLTALLSDTQAGANADVTLTMTRPDKDQGIKNVKIKLPAGLVGSASAAPYCAQVTADAGNCASDSRVGDVTIKVGSGDETYQLQGAMHLTTPPANRPAKLTVIAPVVVGPYNLGKVVVPVDVNLNQNDYSLEATTGDMPRRFEGVPVRIRELVMKLYGIADQGTPGNTADDKPFMSNPRTCAALDVAAEISSPGGSTVTRTATLPAITGCGSLSLANSITVGNSPTDAWTPTTLGVHVNQSTAPTQATLKKLTLPLPGFRLNAAAADGLTACSAAQLNAQSCPASSAVGTAWLDTPLLPMDQAQDPDNPAPPYHSLWGKVYLETPGTAADGSDRYKLAIQLVGKTVITIRGTAVVNETTGEIATVFDNLPDIPFTDFDVEIAGGATPLLLNPETCGTINVVAAMESWAGATAGPSDSVDVTNCAAKSFAPTATVTLSTTESGKHPDAAFNIARPDGNQDIKGVTMSLPAGFVGSAAAVPMCAVADAQAGNCTSASKVGSVSATIGTGAATLTLPGDVYLTAGANGDIAGMAIEVPAIAGPYNLGDYVALGRVVLREADHGIDVTFADVPRMFKGVPTQIRNLDVTIDGEPNGPNGKKFLYNASNCNAASIVTKLTSYDAATANVTTPYQATGCPSRTFNPRMSFTAIGGDPANGVAPAWTIEMNLDPDDSTLRYTKVLLPSAITANLGGLGDLCEAAQAAAWNCPPSSVIGTVSIDTPLMPTPVTGTVHIARGGGAMPDMLIMVGAPINMQIRGQDSFVNGNQIQSVFDNLPDMPWTRMTMNINGGPGGLLTMRTVGGSCGNAVGDFAGHSGQSVGGAPVTISGLSVCGDAASICEKPVILIKTKGVKKKGNKKAKTSLSLSVPSSCKGITGLSVMFPKGTKVNKKLLKYNKKKKALKKNLKNVTGRAGGKSLKVMDFKPAGKGGLKIASRLPSDTHTITINTQKSSVLLPYKTFCGAVKGKGKTKKAKLKKCRNKTISFTFVITREDGSVLRHVVNMKAGDRAFK